MAKQALTPKDQFALHTITDARLSPDGQKVVYVVQEYDLDQDKSMTSLWLLRLGEDQQPFKLTSHTTDTWPRWAPDSQRIAFVSRREEKAALYVINVCGGEAEKVVSDHAPSSSPLWSPDGRSIAFKAIVDPTPGPRYPGEPEGLMQKATDKADKNGEKRQDKVHVITDINYRADGRGLTYDQFAQLFVLSLDTRVCSQLTKSHHRIGDFVWSQSGAALLYLRENYQPKTADYTNTICQLDLGSQAVCELFDFDGSLNRLDLSPAGRWLLLAGVDNSCPRGTGEAMIWAIDLLAERPLDFAHAINLTAGQSASCLDAHWDQTGTNVYFLRHWHGASGLWQLPFSDGQLGEAMRLRITDLATISNFDLAQDQLIFVAHNFTNPTQLYLRTAGDAKQLTQLDEGFWREHALCPAEKFSYQGADGWPMEGWLVRPLSHEVGRRYPTVLSVHGGPTGAYSDSFQFPFQLLAQQGFVVVFTNPRGSVTYGTEFAQGCVNDLGGKDYQDIMLGLDQTVAMGVVDPERVGITGWSYGGFMTCWTVTQTNRFRAAVAGAVISNWHTLYGCSDSHGYAEGLWSGTAFDEEDKYMAHSPIHYVHQVETPIMLLHGEADIRCPINQSEQFFTALRRLGKETVFVRYPGQFHGFTKPSFILDRWSRTVSWFKHYLMEG